MREFWTIFLIVFIAELPCLVRTAALQASSKSLWAVVIGTIVANLVIILLGIMLGKQCVLLPERAVHFTAGLLIIAFGIYLMFDNH